MPKIEAVCLGVGKGASYVMKGITSTAFTILIDGAPLLQVDMGGGVALACQSILGHIPNRIYITHNHTDHTADLPIVVHMVDAPCVLAHVDVADALQQHRLHDAPITHQKVIEKVTWVLPDAADQIPLDEQHVLTLTRSQHMYATYGFVLWRGRQPLLGYPADSGYNEMIYRRAAQAPVLILDGRAKSSADHASFTEIDAFAQRTPDCQIYVVHYESGDYAFAAGNVRLWQPGERVTLLDT